MKSGMARITDAQNDTIGYHFFSSEVSTRRRLTSEEKNSVRKERDNFVYHLHDSFLRNTFLSNIIRCPLSLNFLFKEVRDKMIEVTLGEHDLAKINTDQAYLDLRINEFMGLVRDQPRTTYMCLNIFN